MQLHKRFTADQVKALLQGYCQGVIERQAVADVLGIGKTRFFALLEEYRQDPEHFSLVYERRSPKRLTRRVERAIEKELQEEKGLIDDPELPRLPQYIYRPSGIVSASGHEGGPLHPHRASQREEATIKTIPGGQVMTGRCSPRAPERLSSTMVPTVAGTSLCKGTMGSYYLARRFQPEAPLC